MDTKKFPFQLRAGHFSVRCSTDGMPFQRVTEFTRQKVVLKKKKANFAGSKSGDRKWQNAVDEFEDDENRELEKLEVKTGGQKEVANGREEEKEHPIVEFILNGGDHCTELMLETQNLMLLFNVKFLEIFIRIFNSIFFCFSILFLFRF